MSNYKRKTNRPYVRRRPIDEKQKILNRLSRIEGQIRGLKRLVSEDAYYPDILIQASAASSALGSFERLMLEKYVKTHMKDEVLDKNDEKSITDLCIVIRKLMR